MLMATGVVATINPKIYLAFKEATSKRS